MGGGKKKGPKKKNKTCVFQACSTKLRPRPREKEQNGHETFTGCKVMGCGNPNSREGRPLKKNNEDNRKIPEKTVTVGSSRKGKHSPRRI